MIYIYKGQGVSPLSFSSTKKALHKLGYKTAVLDRTTLKAGLWTGKAKLLVMPGGRDIPYCKALHGEGTKVIREFVENGGSYLGICAGAYFGSSYVEFNKGSKLEVLGNRELRFFPCKAIGPAFGNDTFSYRSHIGAQAARIKLQNDQEIYFFYDGGCFFENAESYALGFYQDLPDSPPAIVMRKIGLGRAVLSGVHIECFFDDLNSKDLDLEDLDPKDPYLKKIAPYLQKNEKSHLIFFKELIQRLTESSQSLSSNQMKM